MLPKQYLSPSLYAISELVVNYKVTAVLCSATQPRITNYIYKDLPLKEIIENPLELAQKLKRVRYQNIGGKSNEEIISLLLQHESGLLIVNSRRHAYTLQQELKSRFDNQAVNLFCLSTLIPPIERSKKISAIKEKLQNGERVYVISTQLIEAGVDIDFPIVFRCISGIDSIIQAGGRANREGKHSLGCVYVFESTSESGKTPRSLGNTAKIAKEVIDNLGDRAFELEGIEKYFDILYSSSSENGFLDEKNILDEFELEAKKLNFKTVSDKFKIIDDNSSNIIIPLDEEAKTLVAQLRENTFNRMTIRKLSHYSVSVYSGEFLKLQKENVIENINGSYVLNNLHYYKNDTGLEVFSGENLNAESMFL
ncbi:hypothetical protein SDC9_98814 [bioreactor metagenome]|uniref:CRISPR-associated nuclease/helicase Cas3 domain-containing protein n=1 Tax=bioreactor metagenome TaxID=1076179 RepID=A0A645AIF2_9ZZZZ